MPEELSEEEREAFKSGVLIPIRLRYYYNSNVLCSPSSNVGYRVIQVMRSWLNKSYDDFKDEQLVAKLKIFINLIQK